MRNHLRLLLAALVLSACVPIGGPGFYPDPQPDYDPIATTALAKATLSALQTISFRTNREYCGYIALDENGVLQATEATLGLPSVCQPDIPPVGWTLIASYHTHGAYDRRADSEVPSASDVDADFQEGVNGYVSTPGGRFWRINGAEQTATLICGPKCLNQDPLYIPDTRVETRYTLAELKQR